MHLPVPIAEQIDHGAKICSKLTIKIPGQLHYVTVVFLLLTLHRLHFPFGICNIISISRPFEYEKNYLENEKCLNFVKITVICKTNVFSLAIIKMLS